MNNLVYPDYGKEEEKCMCLCFFNCIFPGIGTFSIGCSNKITEFYVFLGLFQFIGFISSLIILILDN